MAAVLDAPLGALFEVGRTKAGGAISMAFRAARCTSDGDGGRRRCCWRPAAQMEIRSQCKTRTSWWGEWWALMCKMYPPLPIAFG